MSDRPYTFVPRTSDTLMKDLHAEAFKRGEEVRQAHLTTAELGKANLASEFYRKLNLWIDSFDKKLDDEHEVGIRLVSFGQTVVFHVEELGYHDPSLIVFKGRTDDGNPVTLVQHVSQISFLLMAVKRPDPTTPKKPFGFQQPGTESDDTQSDLS